MSVSQQLLAAFTEYGLPVLFGVILAASIGIPIPASLLLIVAGSFVAEGQFAFWTVIAVTAAAAVTGDQVGYGVGRWGGRRLLRRVTRWIGGEAGLQRAEQVSARWGGAGVFLSRWLLTAAGPSINLTSGATSYPWLWFIGFDVAGELVWVSGYVSLGRMFSDQVDTLSSLLGDLSGAILASVVVLFLAWFLVRSLCKQPPARVEATSNEAELPLTRASTE